MFILRDLVLLIAIACVYTGPHRLVVSAHPNTPFFSRADTPCNSSDPNVAVENDAETTIETFLSSTSSTNDKFYIQGWRWHTLSVIRDSNRLQKYAARIQQDGVNQTSGEKVTSLRDAVSHVIDFNLKGLQRIENDVFFPWLRQKLINEETVGKNAKHAFETVIDGVDCDRKRVEELASNIRDEVILLTSPNSSTNVQCDAVKKVVQMSESLSLIAKSIMDREDRLLVPAVCKVVSSKEQKSFNNKVLRNLGIFESRCHLVGMHDAVYDSSYGNKEEQSMFVEQIPSVARMMIGRWRRSLYEPKAGMLHDF